MQRIGFVVLPGFQLPSIGLLSVFEVANQEIGKPVYSVRLLSEAGGSVRSSIGVSVATEPSDNAKVDTLIVGESNAVGSSIPSVLEFGR